jgi:hypothetical protein
MYIQEIQNVKCFFKLLPDNLNHKLKATDALHFQD